MNSPPTYRVMCRQCKGTGRNQQLGGSPMGRVCDVCKGKKYLLKPR